MSVAENLSRIKSSLPAGITLIAVSKTHPPEKIMEAYRAGHRIFGENKVQEMTDKYEHLPKDIQWHLIGHLQTNKVKYIAPYVALIHSVDSLKLLEEINRQALRNKRVIDCLLQLHIAEEETKFGLSAGEAEALIASGAFREMNNIRITGLMGMATNTGNEARIAAEFAVLKQFFDRHAATRLPNFRLSILSMGMSSDYRIAIAAGSNMIRIGSAVFGGRDYGK